MDVMISRVFHFFFSEKKINSYDAREYRQTNLLCVCVCNVFNSQRQCLYIIIIVRWYGDPVAH